MSRRRTPMYWAHVDDDCRIISMHAEGGEGRVWVLPSHKIGDKVVLQTTINGRAEVQAPSEIADPFARVRP